VTENACLATNHNLKKNENAQYELKLVKLNNANKFVFIMINSITVNLIYKA